MVKSWKDLNAEQYMRLMDLENNEEIIQIVYGKSVKDIPLSELKSENLDFLKQNPEKTDIRFFEHKGKKYGMAKFDELSLGEYIDLTTFAEDWKTNIWKIMAIFYRPIIGLSLKHRIRYQLGKIVYGAGIFADSKKWQDRGSKMLMNLDYKISKYDDTDLKREGIYKEMSAIQFHSFLLFFSLLYLKKMEDTLRSLELPKGTILKKPSPKKPKQNSPSKAGAGTTSSTKSRTRKSGTKTKSSK